jgi:hypothetical protein
VMRHGLETGGGKLHAAQRTVEYRRSSAESCLAFFA